MKIACNIACFMDFAYKYTTHVIFIDFITQVRDFYMFYVLKIHRDFFVHFMDKKRY